MKKILLVLTILISISSLAGNSKMILKSNEFDKVKGSLLVVVDDIQYGDFNDGHLQGVPDFNLRVAGSDFVSGNQVPWSENSYPILDEPIGADSIGTTATISLDDLVSKNSYFMTKKGKNILDIKLKISIYEQDFVIPSPFATSGETLISKSSDITLRDVIESEEGVVLELEKGSTGSRVKLILTWEKQ